MKVELLSEKGKPYRQDQVTPILKATPFLKEHGVEFGPNPDLSLVHHNLVTEGHLASGNLVVIERADSATLQNDEVRRWLAEGKLRGVIKTTTLADMHLHNAPQVEGRYHLAVTHPDRAKPPKTIIPDAELGKIACMIPLMAQRRFAHFRDYPFHRHPKDIPLIALFTPRSGIAEVQEHRQLAYDAAGKVRGAVRGFKLMANRDWLRLLSRACCCLCPFGYGEMCYRDFEAAMMGCVVIKPKCDFVLNYSNFYRSYDNTLPCKMDFSDVPEIVDGVIKNWGDYQWMMEKAHGRLKGEFSAASYAKRLADWLKSL